MYKLFVLICVFIILTGCSQNKDRVIISTTNNRILYETYNPESETVLYSEELLLEIANFSGTKDELISKYNTTCIKNVLLPSQIDNISETNNYYRVIYRAKSKILLLMFDESGNKKFTQFHDVQHDKELFETLKVGQTLTDVKNMDPDGVYLFLYTGRDAPKISSHYTTDGFVVEIAYDSNNVIKEISIDTM